MYFVEGRMKVTPESDCPVDVERPLPEGGAANEQLATLAKALGHPARVAILRALLEKDRCMAGELAEELPLAASTVSQHLKLLKASGLIKGEVEGPRRCYCVDHSVLDQLKVLVERLR